VNDTPRKRAHLWSRGPWWCATPAFGAKGAPEEQHDSSGAGCSAHSIWP